MPVYNVEDYVRQAITSVISQAYKNWELILVDDGSTDSSGAICREYTLKHNNVYLITQENSGLSEARNSGIKAANGEYITFFDSDDFYLDKDYLAHVISEIQLSKCDYYFLKRIVFHNNSYIYPRTYNKNIENCDDYEKLLYRMAGAGELDASACLKFIRKEFLVKNALFFKPGITSEDVEWFFRVACAAKTAASLGCIGYCYRIRADSISHSIKEKNIHDFYGVFISCHNLIYNHPSQTIRDALCQYLAYQYYILLGYVGCGILSKKESSKLIEKLVPYKIYSNYKGTLKTRICAFLISLLGISLASKLLGIYICRKQA